MKTGLSTMTDVSQTGWIWLAKAAGAVAGSAVSLAYILPHGRREAAIRFAVGVACGLVFGGAAGLKISSELEIGQAIGPVELMLMGSAAASLTAWWALGFVHRSFLPRGGGKAPANHAAKATEVTHER
jgi:hypothetical protein